MISVLIADDHGLFRKGISRILNESGECRVIGEAENGQELIDKYFKLKPDIILVDISMPVISGIDSFMKIVKSDKSARALFLSMYDDEEYVFKVFKSGGRGLINKNYLKEDLYKIIQKVYQGEYYFGEKWNLELMTMKVSEHKSSKDQFNFQIVDTLSEREREIFQLIGKGYSSNEIANRINIAKRTVDTHRAHIYDKLGVQSFHDLFKLAVEYTIEKKRESGNTKVLNL